jgi:hypothetical protein
LFDLAADIGEILSAAGILKSGNADGEIGTPIVAQLAVGAGVEIDHHDHTVLHRQHIRGTELHSDSTAFTQPVHDFDDRRGLFLLDRRFLAHPTLPWITVAGRWRE